MPLTQLVFQPGLDTENTETGAESRWTDCDKIRFRKVSLEEAQSLFYNKGKKFELLLSN